MDNLNLTPALDFLHTLGSRIAAADPLHEVLDEIVEFVSDMMSCDSCFIFVLEDDELVLRASKNPHPEVLDRLTMQVGQGITGWVAVNREIVNLSETHRRMHASRSSPNCRKIHMRQCYRCQSSPVDVL